MLLSVGKHPSLTPCRRWRPKKFNYLRHRPSAGIMRPELEVAVRQPRAGLAVKGWGGRLGRLLGGSGQARQLRAELELRSVVPIHEVC